ncbi:hypothetical protein CHS0354_041441 [Potamilus streckersoni]|uniref:CARD domain-containing protein n=1 Tax=Potamilus streckersoni TaxID=2493646 RepID=A0AAE0TAW2_9BIVA|nr:hypothetical protein CHS0354_041441 [Potamilus streckersoni]
MELSQWSKIQANWTFLLANVDVKGILHSLYESETINDDDEERIKAETTTRDQCARLLRILKRKHNSYEAFRNALQKIDQKFIIQKLRDTSSDSAPIEEDDKINAALVENFAESNGSQVSTADVQSAIAKYIHRELDEDEVSKSVSLCFGSDVSLLVEDGEYAIRYFTNLRKKATSPTCDKMGEDIENRSKDGSSKGKHIRHKSKQSKRKPLERMSMEELIKTMECKIKERNMPNPKITETFRQQKVTGEVYHYMTWDEIKTEFPDLTYGERKTLLIIRDELQKEDENISGDDELLSESIEYSEDEDVRLEEDLQRRVESLRKFDTTLKTGDYYRQGSEVITHVTRCHNMIEPIRDFRHDPDKGQDELLSWIKEQVIRFSAACLNDRTNGTLYFGIMKSEDHAEVVGLSVDREAISKGINQAIKDCFYPDQYEIAMKCIREPQFVSVLYKNPKSALYVIEIDIVPNSKLTQEEAFFVTLKCFGHSEMVLLRWHDTIVEKIEYKEWREFMSQRNQLKQLREEREKSAAQVKQISEDLRTKFEGLLYAGNDMSDDMYRMLFLSPLDSCMDQNFIQENFDFVNSLDPTIIFDFSPETDRDGGSIYKYMEEEKEKVLKVLTTDDFDKNGKENKEKPDRLPNLHDDIRSTSLKQWIFCNGYDPLGKLQLDLYNWKQQRSEGFKDTLRFYKDEIPEGRVIAIFCLFSKNYDIMLEAAEEVLIKFQHQWMVLAPNEKIAENWIAELLRRQSVDKETVKVRSVIGMPWNHISQTVSQLTGSSDEASVELPTSTGAFCRVKEKVKNELFDLDIVGRNECQNNDVIKDQHKLRLLKAEVEEHFFRGGPVKWWNFWFPGLVLKRHIHDKLMKLVKETLDGSIDEEDKVGIIHLYHQPGAGGSTTARQILWDLKSEYRCCVLKSITDETCEQISAFRRYEAEDPRPSVILIDNLEEDKVNRLYSQLEEKARVEYRNSEKPFKVFCLLLLCRRKTTLAIKDFKVKKDRNYVMLHHELAENEIAWFHEKNRDLEEKHKLQNGVDPKLLLSFNIMKENFNPDYIQNSVKAFCDDITKPNEIQLLKFLSVMNTFDLDFQPLPVSAFDVIMNEEVLVSYGLVTPGRLRTGRSWECCMSAALKVLLNRASRAGLGKQIPGLCIVNHLFAKEIMNYILKSEKKGVSDVMKEMLNSPIVRSRNMTQKQVLKIVKDVLKKRDTLENGMQEKFSPIMMFIEKEEGQDKAVEVLKMGFEMTNDPMIAQQVSRLFIHCKNWEEAKKYAEEATKLKPQNSFLWDTYGQVYKSQVYDCIKNCLQTGEKLGQEEGTKMVKIALDAIDKFREEQRISEQEKITSQNKSGFVAELRATNMLLDLFIQFSFYPGETKVHKFLIDRKYVPPEFKHFGDEILGRLKGLHNAVDDTMRNLEEKQNHVKDETVDVYRRREQHLFRDQVINLRENLDNYFGENSDEIPPQLVSVDDQNAYRTRRMKRLGGRSLSALLRLPKSSDDSQKLARLRNIMDLAERNVCSLRGKDLDYVIYIGAIIAMKSLKLKSPPMNVELEYNHLLHLSERLFDIGVHDRAYLETFLYLVMLHWPTDNRKNFALCPIPKITDAIRKWKDAFHMKHPHQQPDGSIHCGHRKKDTTYFFLCKGVGLDEILYYEELHRGGKFIRGDAVWRTQIAKERLQRLSGTLTSEGTEVLVQVTSPSGNKSTISIPTSLPIGQRGLWQKRVYFVLGFGWSGPKAYNVTQHDPSINGSGDAKAQSRGENIVSARKHSDGSDKDSDEDDFKDSTVTTQVFRRQGSKMSTPQTALSSLQIFQELQKIDNEISELEKSPSKKNRTRLDELRKLRKELVSDKNVKQLYMDYN